MCPERREKRRSWSMTATSLSRPRGCSAQPRSSTGRDTHREPVQGRGRWEVTLGAVLVGRHVQLRGGIWAFALTLACAAPSIAGETAVLRGGARARLFAFDPSLPQGTVYPA